MWRSGCQMLHGDGPRWWICRLGSWWRRSRSWWRRSRQGCCFTFWEAFLPEGPYDDGNADRDYDIAHCPLVDIDETDTLINLGIDSLASVCHFVGSALTHGVG